MDETEPTSTLSGFRFGKFCSTKLLCVFLTVVVGLGCSAFALSSYGSGGVSELLDSVSVPDAEAFAPVPDGGSIEALGVLEKWSSITPAPEPERRKLDADPVSNLPLTTPASEVGAVAPAVNAVRARRQSLQCGVDSTSATCRCEKAWETFMEMPCGGADLQLSASRLQCTLEQTASPIIDAAIKGFRGAARLAAEMLASAREVLRLNVPTLRQSPGPLPEGAFLEFCILLPQASASHLLQSHLLHSIKATRTLLHLLRGVV